MAQKKNLVSLPGRGGNGRYLLHEFPIDWNGRGFQYEKLHDDRAKYNVFLSNEGCEHDSCDCPDATFRERRCKHIEAARAFLVASLRKGVAE